MYLTLDHAEHLARKTEYASIAAHQDINPINWGDAAAFFLEGVEWRRKLMQDSFNSLRPPEHYSESKSECFKAVARAIIQHLNSEYDKALKELDFPDLPPT